MRSVAVISCSFVVVSMSHSERDLRVPEITRTWERAATAMPTSDPTNPDDPSVNLDTLAAIANAKWWQAHDLEEQLQDARVDRDIYRDNAARLEEQLETAQHKLAREQARKRLYRDEVTAVRDAMVGEGVAVLWSNGQFWIDHLSGIVSNPASEPEAR